MKKRNLFLTAISGLALVAVMAGCGGLQSVPDAGFDSENQIIAMNREAGSGTKISFLELLGLKEADLVTNIDDVASGTEVMLAAIASDSYRIGYVSSGALDDTVKAVAVGGGFPSKEMIQSGAYPLVRNFSLVTGNETSNVVRDFLNYICGGAGDIIEEAGYIAVNPSSGFISEQPEGKMIIAGSTSVTPLMEKLMDAYKIVNPNAAFEINQTDSTGGIQAVREDISEIAMVSRELSEEEASMVNEVVFAKDGIAIVVNKQNPIENISLEELRDIYTGRLERWSECPIK